MGASSAPSAELFSGTVAQQPCHSIVTPDCRLNFTCAPTMPSQRMPARQYCAEHVALPSYLHTPHVVPYCCQQLCNAFLNQCTQRMNCHDQCMIMHWSEPLMVPCYVGPSLWSASAHGGARLGSLPVLHAVHLVQPVTNFFTHIGTASATVCGYLTSP
jgi:hypothetical protein